MFVTLTHGTLKNSLLAKQLAWKTVEGEM